MNVVKCTECEKYIENDGENFYQLWEFVKGSRQKQCVLTLCQSCRENLTKFKRSKKWIRDLLEEAEELKQMSKEGRAELRRLFFI